MKRTQFITAVVLSTALIAPGVAQNATTSMEILREKIKADKKLLVAQNLNLTDAEGAKFWPVYEAYQKELDQVNQRIGAAVKAYADAYNKGPLTAEMAKKLLDEYLAIDDAEAKLRSSATPKILAALPTVKAARYIQIESKIRAEVRYELAAGIPLIE
jgi:hypothetical protein